MSVHDDEKAGDAVQPHGDQKQQSSASSLNGSTLPDSTTPHNGALENKDRGDGTVDETNAPTKEAQATDAPTQDEDHEFVEGAKLFLVASSVSVIMLLSMLDISIIGTAIPQITSDFNKLEDVGWYIGAYQLASATIQPLTGKMLTYFSSKWVVMSFFFVFEVGSAICGAAQSSVMLILGRAVAGLGTSGLMNGSLTIIQGACKPQTRPMYTGLMMGVGQIGIVAGPLIGGVLTEHASWRWCFYINLPLGAVVAAFITFVKIPEQRVKEPFSFRYARSLLPYFDLTGFLLFAPASIMFLMALQFGAEKEAHGWDSPEVIGMFCGAAAMAVIFIIWEYRMGDNAMIPIPMVRQKVVWSSSLNFSLLMMSVMVGSNFMPIYLQSVKALSPTMSGVYMLASILSQTVFILLSGALVTKLGYYIVWAFFAAAVTAIGAGLVTTWDPSSGLGELIGYQILLGARGAGMQMGVIAIQAALPARLAAVGTSFIVFCSNMFGAVFITVANTIFQETLRKEITNNVPSLTPEAAIAAGGSADAVRALAPPGPVREGLLNAYSTGFTNVFYMLVATCLAAFVFAFGMGWVDLRTKAKPEKGDA